MSIVNLDLFESNQGHVGIVGLGYVGLPLSIAFVKAGYTVTGFDIDVNKVNQLNAGAKVEFHDPHVPEIPMTREHSKLAGRRSVNIERAATSDAALIVTDHDAVDYEELASRAKLIVDTRNAMKNHRGKAVIVKS